MPGSSESFTPLVLSILTSDDSTILLTSFSFNGTKTFFVVADVLVSEVLVYESVLEIVLASVVEAVFGGTVLIFGLVVGSNVDVGVDSSQVVDGVLANVVASVVELTVEETVVVVNVVVFVVVVVIVVVVEAVLEAVVDGGSAGVRRFTPHSNWKPTSWKTGKEI